MKLPSANEEGLMRLLEDTERLVGRARLETREDAPSRVCEDTAQGAIRIREAVEAAD